MPTDPHDVYATARGPLARLASPFATRARERRHAQFFALTGIGPDAKILDVGCGQLGLRALEPNLNITGIDLVPQPTYPGPFLQADPADGLPFADGAFDLAYCNSVIEHVPPERRAAFARELRRVARGWYVQTPAWSFPIEPHALLPAAHWLPVCAGAGTTGSWARQEAGRTSRCCVEENWSSCSEGLFLGRGWAG